MLICFEEDCTCYHHELLNCIKKSASDSIFLSIFDKINNISSLMDNSGSMLLHYSAKYGNTDIAKHLIHQGCNVNAQNRLGYTPLMLSVDNKDVDTVEILLKNNADIYAIGPNGISVLQIICHQLFLDDIPLQNQNRRILELFLDKINKDFLRKKHEMKYLLLHQKDLVKLSIVAFGSINVVKCVLKNGYSVNYRVPGKNWTALHCAVMFAKCDNAKMIIKYGANIDAVDEDEKTPLDYYNAAEEVDRNSELLRALLKYSIKLRLAHTCKKEDVEKILWEGSRKSVKAMIQSGIRIDAIYTGGKSLLHILVERENDDILDLFDECRIPFDVDARLPNGKTALMVAATYGYLSKVEFLLDHGADPHLCVNSKTAYIYAIEGDGRRLPSLNFTKLKEGLDVACCLMQNGFNTQTVSVQSQNILDFIKFSNGHEKFSKSVIAHWALLDVLDASTLSEPIRNLIHWNKYIRNYNTYCRLQLEEIKTSKAFYESITLFKLMTESEENIFVYARNQDLMLAFDRAMRRMLDLEYYYIYVLNKRMTNARNKVNRIEEAASAILILTGLNRDVGHKIIDYLDRRDIFNLCRFQNDF